MLYNINFKELFDSKRQAVVQFLSLERRYSRLVHDYRELQKQVELDYVEVWQKDCRYTPTHYKE